MATRSNICLVLNKEDIGKVMKFDETKLPKNVTCDNEFLNMVEEVTLGKTLLEQYNDYNIILNLLLGGDASSINGDNVCQYCAWRGEDWKSVKPKQLDKPTLNEEYLYKFEDGIRYFKDDYESEDWTNLEEYLNTHKAD